jgi:hypothetical protein
LPDDVSVRENEVAVGAFIKHATGAHDAASGPDPTRRVEALR